jgi:Ni/Co efflux regulator RcnB
MDTNIILIALFSFMGGSILGLIAGVCIYGNDEAIDAAAVARTSGNRKVGAARKSVVVSQTEWARGRELPDDIRKAGF